MATSPSVTNATGVYAFPTDVPSARRSVTEVMVPPPSGETTQKKLAMIASPRCGLVELNPLSRIVPLRFCVPFTWSRAMPLPAAAATWGARNARRPGGPSDSVQARASSAAPTRAGSTGNLMRRYITPPTGGVRCASGWQTPGHTPRRRGSAASCRGPATVLGLQPPRQICVLRLEDEHLALLVVRRAVAARGIQSEVDVLARVGERREQLHGVLRVHVVVHHRVDEEQVSLKPVGPFDGRALVVAGDIVAEQSHVALGVDRVVQPPVGDRRVGNPHLEDVRIRQDRVHDAVAAVTRPQDGDAAAVGPGPRRELPRRLREVVTLPAAGVQVDDLHEGGGVVGRA